MPKTPKKTITMINGSKIDYTKKTPKKRKRVTLGWGFMNRKGEVCRRIYGAKKTATANNWFQQEIVRVEIRRMKACERK